MINEKEDESSLFWTNSRGEERCNEEEVLAVLLAEEVVSVLPGDSAAWLGVNCGGVFAWGTVDFEPLPKDKIGELFKMHRAFPQISPSRWCCIQRNERPQKPVEIRWKERGYWDDVMESLPLNAYEINMAERRAKAAKEEAES